jgi:hypothetical protein
MEKQFEMVSFDVMVVVCEYVKLKKQIYTKSMSMEKLGCFLVDRSNVLAADMILIGPLLLVLLFLLLLLLVFNFWLVAWFVGFFSLYYLPGK